METNQQQEFKEALLWNEIELPTVDIDDIELEPTQCILAPVWYGTLKVTENQKIIQGFVFRIVKINNTGINEPHFKEGNLVVVPNDKKKNFCTVLKLKNRNGVSKYLLGTTYEIKFKLKKYATISK